jgi:hypothetical protein
MERMLSPTEHPSRLAMASFLARSKCLQMRRLAQNAFDPTPILVLGAVEDFPFVLAESATPLHSNTDPRERLLVLGKIQNLRVACRGIHNRVLRANDVFSLWRQIGPPWRVRGFVRGREVREGCVIPTFGGGLCQLSGSLLEVALALELELVERHTHTALPSGIPAISSRDATLFWNYVDLRFRSPFPLFFECFLSATSLIIRARGKQPPASRITSASSVLRQVSSERRQVHIESCFTCEQDNCVRHVNPKDLTKGKTAFLIDDYQPEFAELVSDLLKEDDQVLLPFVGDGGWNRSFVPGQCDVHVARTFRVRRSLAVHWAVFRRMTVARAHFELAEFLFKIYARHLSYEVEHIVVSQTLLPHVWRAGLLGGRTFDVLMQRLPIPDLEQRLNHAAKLYPQSKTLVEFRAPRWFREAEQQALIAARNVFTPHTGIAAIHGHSIRLPWKIPVSQNGQDSERDLLVFIGPTLARKGAYAMREAMKRTGLSLTVLGPDLEQPGFWNGLPVIRSSIRELRWERVHTVVQPALFEYWPRQLLRAYAAGANLVVSPLCGIEEDHSAGIYHVPFGDVNQLSATLRRVFKTQGELVCAH